MKSYLGNNTHKNFIANRTFESSYSFTDTADIKKAQHILKEKLREKSKESIMDLSKEIYRSVIEANSTDGNFLKKATKTVIAWDQSGSEVSFAKLKRVIRRLDYMGNLSNWQKELVNNLTSKKETISIYIFNDKVMDNIWITVKEPTTDLILEYSQVYMEFLANNIDVICDFMVFGEKEIQKQKLPKDTIVI